MAHDSPACRILILSSSLQQIFHFVDRVKAETQTAADLPSDRPRDGKSIPWTIANKYYTANVHFEAHEVRMWSSVLADGVPAVIFLWAHGEPYKDNAQYLSKELKSHGLEVSLAVRVEGSSETSADGGEDVDEFLSSLGFEFINVARPSTDNDDDNGHTLNADGVPGLPRVIDALSTIMWPSMVQSKQTRNRKSKARELLDWAREEEENDGLRALVDLDSSSAADHAADIARVSADRRSRMQREMDELERWLEEEEVLRAAEDPWINISPSEVPDESNGLVDPLGMTTSPLGMEPPERWAGMPLVSNTPQPSGFEDDFTVFVSAPPAFAGPSRFGPSTSGWTTPNASWDSDILDPMHTGASYASLGSVSDFEDHRADDDLGLPTKAEIQATSTRIFGSTLSPTSPLGHRPVRTPTAQSPHLVSPSSQLSSTMPFSTSTSFARSDDHESEDGTDYEMGNFDLSRVLNALQNMKEEISGMEDEDERRKAAARAALGLVYGLEQGDDEVSPL